jgi:hypothetical protein
MAARPPLAAVVALALSSLGASFRTQNFLVEAPTYPIAQQVGQYAEQYRREKALQWLGQEMPPWPEPCPLRVTVGMNGSGGATSFAFDRGRILSMDMHIEGTLERLLNSVLPHEVTHTVFAHYFRCPVPRWADEGGSVLSEDDVERARHDQLVRQILNTPGRAIPLRRLFSMTRYPADVMVLYAEGFSVASFLVGQSSRTQFLAFVGQGMRGDWDGACRTHYGYRSVEDLEQAWLAHLRATKGQPPQLASAAGPGPGAAAYHQAAPNQQVPVRQTVPPIYQPEPGRPVARAQAPEQDAPYGYLPDVRGPALRPQGPQGPPAGGARPQGQQPQVPLGVPVFDPSPVPLGQPLFGPR